MVLVLMPAFLATAYAVGRPSAPSSWVTKLRKWCRSAIGFVTSGLIIPTNDAVARCGAQVVGVHWVAYALTLWHTCVSGYSSEYSVTQLQDTPTPWDRKQPTPQIPMIATASLLSETANIQQLSQLAERDQLTKSDRLALYKAAASCGHGSNSIHGKVYDWWAEIDREVFAGKLHPCLIIIGVTEHSGCLANCTPVAGQARITLHQALVRPAETLDDQFKRERGEMPTRWGMPISWMGETILKDALLHEMMHQAQVEMQLRKDGEDPHNGPSWAALCNHAAKYLGLGDRVYFPNYKRRKTKTADGPRKNVWVPIGIDDVADGVRIASQKEITCFPHLTFQDREDGGCSLWAARWLLLRAIRQLTAKGETRAPVVGGLIQQSLRSLVRTRSPATCFPWAAGFFAVFPSSRQCSVARSLATQTVSVS